MFAEIGIRGFKSLQDIKLRLGSFNLFIGTNASGKSNFFDALRVLQGIGNGFTIDEVLNGKPKSATTEVWEGIRGGSGKADFIASDGTVSTDPVIEFSVRLNGTANLHPIDYYIGISASQGCVCRERLSEAGQDVYDSSSIDNYPSKPYFEVRYYPGRRGRQPHLQFEKARPALTQVIKHKLCTAEDKKAIERTIRALSNMQRIDPVPATLREYARAQYVNRMGEHGENFAALVATIIRDKNAKHDYLAWLSQLTPREFEDVDILRGALQEPLFAVREGRNTYPAPVLSDGTLRFAAIAAAFFQPDQPDLLTIEEIENGIHPSRLRLLVELLKSQSERSGKQVLVTTHSPVVLAWLKGEDYKHAFFCSRDDNTGASLIQPLTDIPNFQDIVQRQPISDLFAEGWLETTL